MYERLMMELLLASVGLGSMLLVWLALVVDWLHGLGA